MPIVKITGTNLIRDTASMAVLPNDNTEKNEYYNKLRVIKAQKEEINSMRSEIRGMKEDMETITTLLQQLLEKG